MYELLCTIVYIYCRSYYWLLLVYSVCVLENFHLLFKMIIF